jgi:hypothetical protein
MSDKHYRGFSGHERCQFSAYVVLTVALFFLVGLRTFAADSNQQKVFSSPGDAAIALIKATDKDDLNELASILGSDAHEILYSGDPVADNNARDHFVAKYNQMHRLAYDDRDRVILYVGADNWPFPIPMVKKDEGWVFDTDSGKEEMLYRRIGQNELYTIDVLGDLVDAQQDYASEIRDGGSVKQYAQKIQSDPGRHNGLYWPVSDNQAESPIGPLMAGATAEGYKTGTATPIPFHGYYYRVLTRQGKNVPGGAKNYIVSGKMTKGFAFLAYPATYRASGVMTFMVNQDKVIVQKDLGPDTVNLARAITEYNPDKTWDQVIAGPPSSLWATLGSH